MAREAGKAKVLSVDEFNRVVKIEDGNKRNGLRNVVILYLSFYLGLRVKEIAGLKISDVVDRHGNLKEEITLSVTKGNRIRQAYLSNAKLVASLKRFVQQHVHSHGELLPERPLIVSERGLAFSPNSLQQLFSKIYRNAGIDGASSHSGRRSFATSLINAGVDIRSVQHLLGHSSINTTVRYVQENPTKLQKIMAAFKPCN